MDILLGRLACAAMAERWQRVCLGLGRVGVVILGLGYAVAGAVAEAPRKPIALSCAQADLRLITLIERHGELQDVAPAELARMALVMVGGRRGCAEDRGADGLAFYDSVLLQAVRAKSD